MSRTSLFTSYYANRQLSNDVVKPISISRGNPRFRISYKVEDRIPELVPRQAAWDAATQAGFEAAYFEQLDEIGPDKLRAIFEAKKCERGRPLVLLCFEDLVRPDKLFCHRLVFAGWWKRLTKQLVPEFSSAAAPQVNMTASPAPLPVMPKPVKITRRRGTLPDATSRLFDLAIYVNASEKHLKDAKRGAAPSEPITENKRWVRGEQLWLEAQRLNKELPLIFAVFEDLTYWAVAREIILGESTTSYRFADLRPLRGYQRRHLVVDSTGQALPNDFIRSYAVVRTPEWIT